MADDPTKYAIDVIAHQVVANGDHKDDDSWGLYPEIGELDWLIVQARVEEIVATIRPDPVAYDAAYEHLEQRAIKAAES
jgi:hypothetical protein